MQPLDPLPATKRRAAQPTETLACPNPPPSRPDPSTRIPTPPTRPPVLLGYIPHTVPNWQTNHSIHSFCVGFGRVFCTYRRSCWRWAIVIECLAGGMTESDNGIFASIEFQYANMPENVESRPKYSPILMLPPWAIPQGVYIPLARMTLARIRLYRYSETIAGWNTPNTWKFLRQNPLLRRSGEAVLHLAVPALVLAPASPPANVPVRSLSNSFTQERYLIQISTLYRYLPHTDIFHLQFFLLRKFPLYSVEILQETMSSEPFTAKWGILATGKIAECKMDAKKDGLKSCR